MNNQILVSILAFTVGYIAYKELTPAFKRWAAKRAAAKASVNGEVSADLKALLAGTMKACGAIAEATVALQEEVQRFRETLTADKTAPVPSHTYPDDNYSGPASQKDSELLASTYEKMVSRGISMDVAEQEAKDEAEKKMMYSGAVLGTED